MDDQIIAGPALKTAAGAVFKRDKQGGVANGDEASYPDADGNPTRVGNFHKGLPHDPVTGHVDPAAYVKLMNALVDRATTPPAGDPQRMEPIAVFEAEIVSSPRRMRPFVNPLAGFSGDPLGIKPWTFQVAPAPRIDGAEAAGEAVELYWMAHLRDVPFADFDADPLVAAAAAELSALSDFRGPKDAAGEVTPTTIFRGATPGDCKGPYVSQFFLRDVPFGALTIAQKQTTVHPGTDHMTGWTDWLAVQDGAARDPIPAHVVDPQRRYIRSMRDFAHYVHVDQLYEAYFNACLILLGMRAAKDPGNPYTMSTKTEGFGTLGGPAVLTLVAEVATRALKAVWYQKWGVHRRLRPESFGGLVQRSKTCGNPYGLHADVLNAEAITRAHALHDSYLLPMAYPEGSPMHPAYGAGHATVAGACVTVLKAFFDENMTIIAPVRPAADGLGLEPYNGPDLKVGDELNKLAANVAIGRNMAGVHWRTDYDQSLRLGEEVTIQILQGLKATTFEEHEMSFTRFDGTSMTI